MAHTPKPLLAHPDSWAAHLDPDETLVWTGKPVGGFRFYIGNKAAAFIIFVQVTFGVFLVSLLSMAILMFQNTHPALTALALAAPGSAALAGIAFWKWLKRRSAHYALTSKRAIVAYRFPFKHMKSYPIYRDQPFVLGKTRPGTIFFAHTRRSLKYTSYRVFHGFEHLEDFETALERATYVQQAAPWRPRSYAELAPGWPSKSQATKAV